MVSSSYKDNHPSRLSNTTDYMAQYTLSCMFIIRFNIKLFSDLITCLSNDIIAFILYRTVCTLHDIVGSHRIESHLNIAFSTTYRHLHLIAICPRFFRSQCWLNEVWILMTDTFDNVLHLLCF